MQAFFAIFLLFACLIAVAVSQSDDHGVHQSENRTARQICHTGLGGNCYECDCKPAYTCLKGKCVEK